jgi:undecaprenyl-diphosphatase
MTFLEALLLGIVQGMTEFFPVSSSSHLILVQEMLGLEKTQELVFFDLLCHLGTLGAVFFFFRKEIVEVFQSKSQMALFAVALLPLFPLALVLKTVEQAFHAAYFMGLGFLITAVLLFLGEYLRLPVAYQPQGKRKGFLIGCFQAFAIFPGISRSGVTISTARTLGFSLEEAVKFSFILSIPTILGGIALKLLKGLPETASLSPSVYIIAFTASLASGLLTIRALFWVVRKNGFVLFAWYCLLMAGILILLR